MAKEFPLSLVIKAVDRATAPLRAINERIAKMTAPIRKLNNAFVSLAAEAGLPKLFKGFGAVGSAAKNVAGEAVALGAKFATMAAGAGFALFSIVKGAVDAGDKLGEMAQRVGLSVDAYAQLQFAAAQADVEQEQFNSAMDQFNKRMGEAKTGGGEMLGFLQKVLPAFAPLLQKSKTTEEAIGVMTDAFAKIEDPSKRAALAAAAFGKSGLQMGQFLGQGSKAIDAQRKKFLALAGSQERFAAGAGDLDNAMREAETAFGGLRNAVAVEFFPVFLELAGVLRDFLSENREGLAKWAKETATAISAWVKSGGIQRVREGFERFMKVVNPIVDRMGGWPVVIGGLAAALASAPLLAAIGSLAVSLLSLGAASLPVTVALLSIGSAAGMIIGNWSEIGTFFADLVGGLTKHFEGFRDFVVGVFSGDLSKAWEGIKGMFSGGVGFLTTILDGWVALMKVALAPFLEPIQWAMKAAGVSLPEAASFRELAGTGAPTGAANAGPAAAGSETRIVVDFNNAPPGTRTKSESNGSAPIDLSMGYSMVAP